MMASALTSAACAPAATVTASARAPTVCSRYPDSLVLIMIGSLPLAPVCADHIVFYATFELCPQGCHPRESGGPGQATERLPWIPAFAGMTMESGTTSVLQPVNPRLTVERLADRHQLAGPLLAQLRDLLRRVAEDAAAGLHAEFARCRARGHVARDVAAVAEVFIQVAADGLVDVEPGHVEQGHRADHGELVADAPGHAGVQALGVDHALLDQLHALPQQRIEDAVLDEAGNVLLHDDRQQAEIFDGAAHPVDGLLARLVAGDHFDHGYDVGRIRPVHADHAAGRRIAGLQLGDGDARGVGGNDAFLADELVDLLEHLGLDVGLFRHRLDHDVGAFEGLGEIVADLDLGAAAAVGHAETGQHARRHADAVRRALALLGHGIEDRHRHAAAGERRRDPRPHRTQTNHCCFRHVIPRTALRS